LVGDIANVNVVLFMPWPRMTHSDDRNFMSAALEMARTGGEHGEVPVGAVAVVDHRIVGRGFNQPIALSDPTAHAEVLALREAARSLDAYRLTELTLYVTLEPCVMCIGAMLNARISRLVYGARDEKAGAVGSVYDIGRDGVLNHRIEVTGGIMEPECAAILREFFRARRP
jgi:tRNA(adenine34) deaminase